ncbi:Pro-cathepsin H [Fukomys damarensis]|uniref:Pro-cathepsin H n=1 Tax=Fukomys damarensis TaxID=885580 RepID=A0A091DFK2_FUKDA|nr:Pro-cathepsin H [Fukomys damarensis]
MWPSLVGKGCLWQGSSTWAVPGTSTFTAPRGSPSQAFEFILYKSIMGKDTHPCKGKDGHCRFQPQKATVFAKDVDEEAMVEAVALYNPVSFAFKVSEDFMSYKSEIYCSTSCHKTRDKVNYMVLAVGYRPRAPYWTVEN